MTRTWDLNPIASIVSTYNAFHAQVKAAFLAFGWTQTTDTGQVDFATNAAQPAETALTNYQIFKMGDSLAATAPVYVKIWYCIGGSSSQAPCYIVQVGFGSDGAGNLTGDVTPLLYLRVGDTSSSPGRNQQATNFASGDGGRIVFMFSGYYTGLGTDTGTTSVLSIERSRDSDGNYTNEYVCVHVTGGNTTNKKTAILHRQYGALPYELYWGSLVPYDSTTGMIGDNGGAFPVFPAIGKLGNPLLNIATFKRNDFPIGMNIYVPYYGSSRRYKAFKTANIGGPSIVCPTASNDTGVLILWE